ncbi:MAG: hypothetical protein IT170_13980 [Bryobacterales bacterium]|nr:hypothetical protein [Bryobacterales bacterium]
MRRLFGARSFPVGAILVTTVLAALLSGCGRYMKLDGSIGRVRVVETGSPRNVLVVEFEVTNTASVPYVVKEAELEIPVGGGTEKGDTVAVQDALTLCRHMASLNNDCAQPLTAREAIAPGATVRRMVAASFAKTAKELRERPGLLLRIRELDRMETELREKK